MNAIIEALTGMNKMSDQVIATDFLIAAKSGIRNYAMALTETGSPQLREIYKKQLDYTIAAHEAITNYMIKNGYYHAYDIQEQFKVDLKTTDTALNLTDSLM